MVVTFTDPTRWHARGNADTDSASAIPTQKELEAEFKRLLALPEHKELLKSELVKKLEFESLEDTDQTDRYYHRLIFTPPYRPRTQPCEHLWAYVKNYTASQYHEGRGLVPLREQVRRGFYGDGERHKPADVTMVRKLIGKAHKHIDEFILEDPMFQGKLRDLTGDEDYQPKPPADEVFDCIEDLPPAGSDDSIFPDVALQDGQDVEVARGYGNGQQDEEEEDEAEVWSCGCEDSDCQGSGQMVGCDTCDFRWFFVNCKTVPDHFNVAQAELFDFECCHCARDRQEEEGKTQ